LEKNNQTIIGENQETLIVKEAGIYQVTIEEIGTSVLSQIKSLSVI
jgi:hypothetical protein